MRRRTFAITVRWRGLFCFCATLLLALIISGTSIAEEVTIDNGDPGTSYTGIWPVSGGSYPFGDDSLYSKDAGSTYTFETALSGPYDVFFRWTVGRAGVLLYLWRSMMVITCLIPLM